MQTPKNHWCYFGFTPTQAQQNFFKKMNFLKKYLQFSKKYGIHNFKNTAKHKKY